MASELELNDNRVEFIADYVLKNMKLKGDKWMKMYNTDEIRQMFLDFFEKPEIPALVITLNSGGVLVSQHDWPQNPKGKTCYFVKKGRDAITKDTVLKTAFVYGDLAYMPLDQLSAFVDEVYNYIFFARYGYRLSLLYYN